jgi:hypothetical protein
MAEGRVESPSSQIDETDRICRHVQSEASRFNSCLTIASIAIGCQLVGGGNGNQRDSRRVDTRAMGKPTTLK